MESTGRTRSAEHVTGTGMAQLAIDRHAASATRQAVTAPASTLEGIMVERAPLVEPVTLGGWYERTDGTVTEYWWRGTGQLHEGRTVASWAVLAAESEGQTVAEAGR